MYTIRHSTFMWVVTFARFVRYADTMYFSFFTRYRFTSGQYLFPSLTNMWSTLLIDASPTMFFFFLFRKRRFDVTMERH